MRCLKGQYVVQQGARAQGVRFTQKLLSQAAVRHAACAHTHAADCKLSHGVAAYATIWSSKFASSVADLQITKGHERCSQMQESRDCARQAEPVRPEQHMPLLLCGVAY